MKKIMKDARGIVEKSLEDVDETVRGAAMRYILYYFIIEMVFLYRFR